MNARPSSRYWSDLTSEEFARLDRDRVIAVLPVGATEQHGPHLPMSTDTATVDGMVRAAMRHLPDELPVLFLPTLAYGKSNEHSRFPGTLTVSAETLTALWKEIGACVARSGVRKLVLYNSHGGQIAVMDIVARDLREAHGMLVVTTNWFSLGLPPGLVSEQELRHGIHAGELESSLMLALDPGHVRRDRFEAFGALTHTLQDEYRLLSIGGPAKLGWQMHDLNPQGAAGDATRASAEQGAAVLDHVGRRFVELLQEVDRFPLSALDNAPGWR